MTKSKTSLRNDERGIAAIIISIFIMLLLSLVVLAISRDANREQRQALDRQLNSQAFYAAESGVNDLFQYVKNNPGVAPVANEECDPTKLPGYSAKPELDPTGPVSYSCALYDTRLETLQYDEVKTHKSQIIPITPAPGSSLDRLTISWRHEAVDPAFAKYNGCSGYDFRKSSGVTRFPPAANYPNNCDAGFLRAELVDTRGGYGRQQLADKTFIGFFVPRNGGGSPTVAFNAQKGTISRAGCANGGMCRMTITGLKLKHPDKMYLRLTPIYKTAFIQINGQTIDEGQGSTSTKFTSAQMLADVTGKANDVLKRIQVRISLENTSSQDFNFRFPEFAIHGGSNGGICKRLKVLPPGIPGASSSDGCTNSP